MASKKFYNSLLISILCAMAFIVISMVQQFRINSLTTQVEDLRTQNISLFKNYNEQVGAASLSEKLRREEDIKLHAVLATAGGPELNKRLQIAEQEYNKRIAEINCIDLETCIKLLCAELKHAGFKTECVE